MAPPKLNSYMGVDPKLVLTKSYTCVTKNASAGGKKKASFKVSLGGLPLGVENPYCHRKSLEANSSPSPGPLC